MEDKFGNGKELVPAAGPHWLQRQHLFFIYIYFLFFFIYFY